MGRTFITGDTHAEFNRLSTSKFKEQANLTKDDVVIILGDFGGIWNANGEDGYERWWLNWLESKPFTTVFVDGNHENFDRLAKLEEREWNGGKVGVVRESIFHLKRGEVFNINGKTFLAIGGAKSVDQEYREEGKTWWPQEEVTDADLENADKNLEKVGNKVNYILAHDIPLSKKPKFNFMKAPSATNWRLEQIHQTTEYEMWFAGHYHMSEIDEKQKLTVLYKRIIEI